MVIADLLAAGVVDGPELGAALEAAGASDLAAVIALSGHSDPAVRAAVARELPLLHDDPPGQAALDAVVALTRDPVAEVRDWACFDLGQQWREVDAPAVRQALAERLDDEHDDTRCEALLGLAHRQDPRALPAVRAALSRPDGNLFFLELLAAGALADPSLHELVLRHVDGWDPSDELQVEAVRRLTDPAGTGQDLVEGVAELYRRRARGLDDGEAQISWRRLDAVLDLHPTSAPRVLAEVTALLADDPAALTILRTRSALAQLAAEVAAQL